jgi:hypothetical protein
MLTRQLGVGIIMGQSNPYGLWVQVGQVQVQVAHLAPVTQVAMGLPSLQVTSVLSANCQSASLPLPHILMLPHLHIYLFFCQLHGLYLVSCDLTPRNQVWHTRHAAAIEDCCIDRTAPVLARE